MVWGYVCLIGLALIGTVSTGCKPKAERPQPSTNLTNKHSVRPAKIIAQGQLMPAGGLLRLNGAPGDVVESISVNVGDQVPQNSPLITLRSATVRQSQLETLKQQLEEAELQQSAAIDRAQIELSAARMQLSQAEEQSRSVERRGRSLPLLKQQWTDAQAALGRAESLSKDPLTRGMVSLLDIDKQRASVTAAQLQYESQQESLEQAKDTAQWSTKLAREKVSGAERSLMLAQKADPSSVIRSQITSAEQQLASSQLVSPIDGNVVSVDARVGESVAQFPLVQVADLSKMVCQVEIYQTDAPLVAVGQDAELRSDAFVKPLRGKVSRINRLVGYPQLRSTDPLAKTDYRTLPVLVEILPEDTAEAARWLQLQVEVTIPLAPAAPDSKSPDNKSPDDKTTESKTVKAKKLGVKPVFQRTSKP